MAEIVGLIPDGSMEVFCVFLKDGAYRTDQSLVQRSPTEYMCYIACDEVQQHTYTPTMEWVEEVRMEKIITCERFCVLG